MYVIFYKFIIFIKSIKQPSEDNIITTINTLKQAGIYKYI